MRPTPSAEHKNGSTAAKDLLTLVHERLARPDPAGEAATSRVLTRRELELLRLMSLGLNTAAAAERLRVSTVASRRSRTPTATGSFDQRLDRPLRIADLWTSTDRSPLE